MSNPLPACDDIERRRFLCQLATGTGALLLGGVTPVAWADDTDEAVERAHEIEEDRGLWLASGYLILLKWRRPADDPASVAALEGLADELAAFLATAVDNVDKLHNIDQLNGIERQLVDFIQPHVEPARILRLHLDHDCTTVCGGLAPSVTYPAEPHVLGWKPSPRWK